MLLQVSYYSKQKERQIKELVGEPFGLIHRIKNRGIGSQKFTVRSANAQILDLYAHQSGEIFTNIELRPKGIILWFRSRIDVYALMMPYYKLSVYNNAGYLNVYADTWKVILKPAHNQPLNMSFVTKLLSQKNNSIINLEHMV